MDIRYQRIGAGYARHRREDPAVYARILAALGGAQSVVNVGAGAGSYEPRDRRVLALEPSRVMVGQRAAGSAPAVLASADALPLPITASTPRSRCCRCIIGMMGASAACASCGASLADRS